MKPLFTSLTVMLLLLTSAVFAQKQQIQEPKKAYFKNFPKVVTCKETEIQKLFSVAQGREQSITLSPDFTLKGKVISNVVKYHNLQCMTIKLPEFGDAVFGLSKRIDENNNIIYSGRIINPKGSDAYELRRTATGSYQLVKIELNQILQDCSQQ